VRKHDGVHLSNDLNWSRWGSLTHSEWRCLLHWTSVLHEWKNELMPSNTTDFILLTLDRGLRSVTGYLLYTPGTEGDVYLIEHYTYTTDAIHPFCFH